MIVINLLKQDQKEMIIILITFITFKATDDEINNAYRRLSRLYHPDKHTDPERKVEAELLFGKTKRAYEGWSVILIFLSFLHFSCCHVCIRSFW